METICRAMSIKSFMSRVSRLGKTLAILSLKGIKERAARMALCKAVPLIDLYAAVMAGSSGLFCASAFIPNAHCKITSIVRP